MSLTTIPDFHELILPHEDGDLKNRWCTFAKDNGMLYLLNGGRFQLSDLMEIDIYKDIHFDSEAECHNAAYVYYRQHNKSYPYAVEWRKSLEQITPTVSDEVVSEHMTFA